MRWSARRQILGKAVFNDKGERIGSVDDIVIAPDKAVPHAIISTGGFLHMAKHDVVIPVDQIQLTGCATCCIPVTSLTQ